MKKYIVCLVLTLLFVLLWSCQETTKVSIAEQPHQYLSDYHFFSGSLAQLKPNEGVLPYDLNSPLFTDYAQKARFVWMPEGKKATYQGQKVLDMPEGTVLIKNFYYYNDERKPDKGRKIIETRLLIHQPTGWQAYPYIWNAEQTDAELKVIGGMQEVEWINQAGEKMHTNYIIPNKNQCKGCHFDDHQLTPIGPKAANLNKTYPYTDGAQNQLEKWVDRGYLQKIEKEVPTLAQWENPSSANLHERAMAYLEINCAHCHNPNGPANTSGLNLMAHQPLGLQLGVYKSPVATGRGSGGRRYSIVPRHPEKSILVYRMQSTDPGAMMPELGRTLVHQEGVALIEEWISAMDSSQFRLPTASPDS